MYTIKPDNLLAFDVFCDQTTEGDKYKLILGSYSGRTVISSLLSSHAKNGRGGEESTK